MLSLATFNRSARCNANSLKRSIETFKTATLLPSSARLIKLWNIMRKFNVYKTLLFAHLRSSLKLFLLLQFFCRCFLANFEHRFKSSCFLLFYRLKTKESTATMTRECSCSHRSQHTRRHTWRAFSAKKWCWCTIDTRWSTAPSSSVRFSTRKTALRWVICSWWEIHKSQKLAKKHESHN